ncbi:hypothetical protein CPB83DRAFT_843183 [Crepidotus variabilis]|uniref:Uncharacterized protein n=1 Tax=Crepidotus variabilis TaxID=179855 RepID=A0A9P6ETK4_9AGAR|nr:hypothetical protein CPB83DRAFT_843183 [Crepidotus variabilis]
MADTSSQRRFEYKSSQSIVEQNPTKRPNIVREHSENLLSYYESSIPNETSQPYPRSPSPIRPANHQRTQSSGSTSSSDYSDNTDTGNETRDGGSETSSSATKRLNGPSKGSGDRRRVAIMEMDTVEEGYPKDSAPDTASRSGSIRQRRGYKNNLAGLALVAPPDAALRSYTHLTPPSTAPLLSDSSNQSTGHRYGRTHHRSSSEITHSNSKRLSPRDPSTVGKAAGNTTPPGPDSYKAKGTSRSKTKDDIKRVSYTNALSVPDSAMSQNRSPSPGARSTQSDRSQRAQSFLSPYSGSPNSGRIDMFSPIVTPAIGEGKEIHVPVAAPVIVNLDRTTFREKSPTSSKLSPRRVSPAESGSVSTNRHDSSSNSALPSSYAPASHSPEPPASPPRAIEIEVSSPPPPRPPRLNSPAPPRRGDLDFVKQPLQMQPSATSALTSKPTGSNSSEIAEEVDSTSIGESNEGGSTLFKTRSVHRREAASVVPLSASSESASASSASSSPRTPPTHPSTLTVSMEVPTNKQDVTDVFVSVVEPPTPATLSKSHAPQKIDHAKFDRWLNENPLVGQPLEARRANSIDESHHERSVERSSSPASHDHHYATDVPSPPNKSLRQSITKNIKRLSALPRAPSISSKSDRRLSSEMRYSSRTPSPRHSGDSPQLSFKKIKSTDPAALFCHEVYGQNTTLQRCYIYASKINELYLYDCGLSDWITEMKEPSIASQPLPRGPSTMPFTHQPRQTSRSSIMSEATFPRRPDATTATDLSGGGYRDITPPGMPQLPYPALAINPPRSAPARSNTSISSGTPPPSIRSLAPSLSTSSKAGFFASLGRKASLSKKDRPAISSPVSSAPGARLPLGIRNTPSSGATSSGPPSVAISRPIQITSPPLVPGGPRAPPQRAKRSQTFMSSTSPSSTSTRSRDDSMGRRPSLYDLSPNSSETKADPEFSKQVDKLAILIPRADRSILAGYLRRAGSDMLAIGQYLEDERMGTIRRF